MCVYSFICYTATYGLPLPSRTAADFLSPIQDQILSLTTVGHTGAIQSPATIIYHMCLCVSLVIILFCYRAYMAVGLYVTIFLAVVHDLKL